MTVTSTPKAHAANYRHPSLNPLRAKLEAMEEKVQFTGLTQNSQVDPAVWLKTPISALELTQILGQPCAFQVEEGGGFTPKRSTTTTRRMSVAEAGVREVTDLAGQAAVDAGMAAEQMFDVTQTQVRKAPSSPRSWANFSPLHLCSHRHAWVNLPLVGQPNTFLAAVQEGVEACAAKGRAHERPAFRRAHGARIVASGTHVLLGVLRQTPRFYSAH